MDLDEEEIKQKIMQTIDDTSSILDVLKLGSSEYGFMAKAIIKKNDEITDKELGDLVKEIRNFIDFTRFSVINYVQISDKKDLAIIIKDKYKLFGIQVSKENFQEDNIDDLIKKVKVINNYNDIQKSNISVGELQYVVTVKRNAKKIIG